MTFDMERIVESKISRIHIFGASGSGTTTLAAALSRQLNCRHFDTDDYFWHRTDSPFREKRERSERVRMLVADLASCRTWILSGCICGWDEDITPMFHLAVFLWIPSHLRMARLERREVERYGEEVVRPGGIWDASTAGFLEWAALYDDAGLDVRSRLLHETWIKSLECPVLRLEGDMTVEERVGRVMEAMNSRA